MAIVKGVSVNTSVSDMCKQHCVDMYAGRIEAQCDESCDKDCDEEHGLIEIPQSFTRLFG